MSAVAKARVCSCGCEQAPAETTRLRKLECAGCGYTVRIARRWLAHGVPSCPCGVDLEPACLLDRVVRPGDEGHAAYVELMGAHAEREQRSEYAKRAVQLRRRCKDPACGAFTARGALYCSRHAGEEMPF